MIDQGSTAPKQAITARGPTSGFVGVVSQFAVTALRNRGLLAEMVMRDLKSSHVGHGLGSAWIYIQPLVIVLTFMLIFGVVIGSKMSVTSTFPGDYTSYILSGLVPWLVMSNVLGRGPSLLVAHANLVKQVVFPIEILPVSSVLSCFAIYVPSCILLILYKVFFGGGLSLIVVLLPVAIGMHMLLSIGLMLFLSVVTPFLRDVREVVGVYTVVAMYFTPAVYLPDWVPAAVRPVLYLNPFSYVVWVYQDILFFGQINHGFAWIVFAVMTAVMFVAGLMIFRKLKPFLGNVL